MPVPAIEGWFTTDDEPTLLSLAAQLEDARPWPLTAPMS